DEVGWSWGLPVCHVATRQARTLDAGGRVTNGQLHHVGHDDELHLRQRQVQRRPARDPRAGSRRLFQDDLGRTWGLPVRHGAARETPALSSGERRTTPQLCLAPPPPTL